MTTLPRDAVWLISGCSTGLGRALAAHVLARGYRCVVSARRSADVADIVARHAGTALAAELDVTNAAQIERIVAQATSAFGAIDVLVNNAGYGYLAAIEEGDDAEVRAMFETNFFGLAALTRAVLPGMRARRRGHVINISSVGGLIGNPSSGYYAATKFAVEGLSEALAHEVADLGLRVSVIEPGPFRTDWAGRSLRVAAKPIEAYAATAIARRQQLQRNSGRQPGDPDRAAEAIVAVAEAMRPPLRLVLGRSGFERVREKFVTLLASMDEWKDVTLGCDQQEPEGPRPES
jgi:NAD(P)-dependent dehydrogenase (short-subunit alcohol dehydrogenase family)